MSIILIFSRLLGVQFLSYRPCFVLPFFSTLFSDLKTPSKQEFSFVGQLVTSSDVMR